MNRRCPQLALFVLLLAPLARAQSNVAERYLIAAANQERAQQGIAPLVPDPSLASAARDHAREMSQRQDISHQFPGEISLFPRIQRYSRAFDAVVENVAYAPNIERIHTGWMNSAGHRANLLNPAYNTIGVSVIVNGREVYAVEDFGHSDTANPTHSRLPKIAPPQTDTEPPPPPLPSAEIATTNINAEALYLFNAANRERAQQHTPALRWDPTLAQAATFHAQQMAAHQNISHQFPNEPELSTRGASAGAHFSLISENVAEAPTAARVHTAWMQSEGHRENILDPKVDSIGIAVIVRNGQRYAVQDFARTTQNLTLEQQEAAVAALLDTAGLTLKPSNSDARATCATSTGFHGQNQPGFIMRYTSASLDVLPDQLNPRLQSGKYRQASVGACAQNGKGPFSTYRIAILLYP